MPKANAQTQRFFESRSKTQQEGNQQWNRRIIDVIAGARVE